MDQRPLILIPAGTADGKTLAYDAATGLAKPTGYSNADVDAALSALSGSIGGVESALTAHSDDATIHRSINDAGSAATDLWSASKISTELAGKLPVPGELTNLEDAGTAGQIKRYGSSFYGHNGTRWVRLGSVYTGNSF